MKSTAGKAVRRAIYAVLIVAWLALVLIPFTTINAVKPCEQASPGVFDLSGCALDEREVYKLNGKWQFYPNVLLGQSDFATVVSAVSAPGYIDVPIRPMMLPLGHNEHGYATYRLTVIHPEEPQRYGLKITNVRTASALYVNGQLLGQSGLPADSAGTAVAGNHPYTAYFDAEGVTTEIILHISNYLYWYSGISEPVYWGDAAAIERLLKRNETYDVVVIVSLAVMGIYFLGQGLQRRADRAFIFLALFCIMAAVYTATHSEKLLYDYAPNMHYESFHRIQSWCAVIGGWSLVAYTHYITQKSYSVWIFKLTSAGLLVYLLANLMFGIEYISLTERALGIVLVFCSLYIVYAMVRAIFERTAGFVYLLAAMLGVLPFVLSLVANVMLSTDVYMQPPVGIFIFVLAQGLFLADRSHHAYLTIRQLTTELQRTSREKDQFLHKTSQELRVPLQAMKHMIRAMLEGIGGTLSARQRKDMLLVEHAAKRLSLHMNDILDYERMKDGTIRLERRALDLYGSVEVVIEIFRQLHGNGRMQLTNRMEPRQFFVYADENRVTQIIYNLIQCAIGREREGDIEVAAAANAQWLRVAVTGAGLHASGEDGNEKHGLAISRMLVQLHGGEFAEQSVSRHGCRFVFTLPLTDNAAGAAEAAAGAAPETSSSQLAGFLNEAGADARSEAAEERADEDQRYSILVVDEYVHGRSLVNLLQAEGFEAVGAVSAGEALGLLSGGASFDLCMIDVVLPDMSGFALCREIRQHYNLIDLPILLTAASSLLQLNETGLAAGANDLIRKPYEREELVARVRILVQLKRATASLLHSEIAMLQAQIKPHFLFNAINTMIWMSKRDMERTRQLLRDLSSFLRGSFDFGSRESLAALQDEMKLVRAYVALEQARFGERLQVVYDVQADMESFVPPLVLQPLVENAIRHGVSEKEEGGTVLIRVRDMGADITIEVADTGVGMAREQLERWRRSFELPSGGQGSGVGLSNVNRRLMRMFGRTVQLEARDGGGTVATVRLPKKGGPA